MQDNEDPMVMYLVVRTSLRPSPGKLSAQVGHAVQMICLQYARSTNALEKEAFEQWLAEDYPKVTLRASDSEFDRLRDEIAGTQMGVLVVDNGRTELPPGSQTVIGMWPRRKSSRPKNLKRLRLLEPKDLGLVRDSGSPSE